MEVNEKAHVSAAQLQVRQKLRLVNGMKAISTFQFDNNRLLNQQIETVTEVDGSSIVNDRQHNLIPNLQSLLSQLMNQARLISTLQQSWTEEGMNLHGSGDDNPGKEIDARCGS